MSKVNMFHLSDILTKQKDFSNQNTNSLQMTSHGETSALQEKIDALVKICMRSTQPGYQQAMRSLLTSGDFFRIREKVIKVQILQTMGDSIHFQLIEPLNQLLSQANAGDREDEEAGDLLDLIEDTIS